MDHHVFPKKKVQAWVVDVNMGYGHSRAAYALRDLCGGEVISANDYHGIPASDQKLWKQSREIYETVSRLKPLPIVGDILFEALDRWQEIPAFYPRRDLSEPNLQIRQIYHYIEKKEFIKHLIDQLAKKPVPLITTFFATAFAADYFDYPGDIYCVTTDADVSRSWAPLDPKKSRIKYFASNGRVVERLKLYGVREENIFLTGFPLPKQLIGGPDAKGLKDLLAGRICNLDPQGIFSERYAKTLMKELGPQRCRFRPTHPLTLMYTVGGAGAQKHLAVDILKSLRGNIARHELRMILVAGTRPDIVEFFRSAARDLGLRKHLEDGLVIPSYATRQEYFDGFTDLLRHTDILWTKPSELSFYAGAGITILMAPPIGSQEEFNRTWLQYVGGGVSQSDTRYTNEWLFDWINSGGLARLAWSGYVEAPTHGTYRIEDTVLGRPSEIHKLPMIV